MKRCTKCDEVKPLTEFHNHKITKDGLSHQCKECNRQKAKEYSKTPTGVYSAIRGRIKHYKTKPFLISKEEFIDWYEPAEKRCAYCDISEEELELLGDSYNNKAHRLTVDCVDNKLGYTKGNLVLACLRCNSIKSDFFTPEEMRSLSQQFITPKWQRRLS